jgi:hemerythrin-like domain-containing protein
MARKDSNLNELDANRPTKVLRDEHQVILRVLNVLERLVERARDGAGFESGALGQCVEFFRLFADACHHAKEEDLLFPVLESHGIPRAGGPIGVMLYEHQMARQLTQQMGEALTATGNGQSGAAAQFCAVAERYVNLLKQHIYKEDNFLFTMGERVMPDAAQQDLCSQFCAVGCRSFGGKKLAELTQLADALSAEWGDVT